MDEELKVINVSLLVCILKKHINNVFFFQSTSIVDMTLSKDKSSEGFIDEHDVNMNTHSGTGHKKLLMKLNPQVFDKVVENLTPHQKDWVKSTSFGDLFSFKFQSGRNGSDIW